MMKRNKILKITLILAMILSLAFPAFAAGEGEPAPEPAETVQPPEEGVNDPAQDGSEEPDADEETPAVPADPVEDEEIPPAVDGGDETPGEGEDPAQPSENGEAPVEEEENPDGETPVEEDGEAPEEEPAADEEGEADPQAEPRVIDVVVPPSGQVVINPYNMEVATTYGESTEQIIHEPQVMISGSDFPVLVAARVVGFLSPESAARFVSAPPVNGAVDKEIFMYMEFQNDPMLWSGSFGDWPNQILVTDLGLEKESVMMLDAFGAGYFRLFGAMTGFPDVMWDEVDAPDVTVAFTFAPLETEPAASPEDALPEEAPPEEDLPSADLPEEDFPNEDNLPEDVPLEGDFPAIEEIPSEGDLPAEEVIPEEEDGAAPEDTGVDYGW